MKNPITFIKVGQKFPYEKKEFSDFKIGLVIDKQIRELFFLNGGIPSSYQYAPYDIEYHGIYIDVKSYSKQTITLSGSELEFACEGDRKYYLAVFKQEKDYFTFMGFLNLFEITPFMKESSNPNNVYFWLNDIKDFLKGELK